MFLVFDWWLDLIWLKSHRNATNCIDFNIVIRILNTPVSAKMAQGQRKWHVVLGIFILVWWYFCKCSTSGKHGVYICHMSMAQGSHIHYYAVHINNIYWKGSYIPPMKKMTVISICIWFCIKVYVTKNWYFWTAIKYQGLDRPTNIYSHYEWRYCYPKPKAYM